MWRWRESLRSDNHLAMLEKVLMRNRMSRLTTTRLLDVRNEWWLMRRSYLTHQADLLLMTIFWIVRNKSLVTNTKMGQFAVIWMLHSLGSDMWDNSKIWSGQWIRLFMAYNRPLPYSEDFANPKSRSRQWLYVPWPSTLKSHALDSLNIWDAYHQLWLYDSHIPSFVLLINVGT
jgi:hypothetical protein